MASIYLLRHGKASFGAADYDRLDPIGIRQAECLGSALAVCRLGRPVCFSGDMRRQRATLAACLSTMALDAEVLVDPRWNEFDHERIVAAAYPGEVGQLRSALALEVDPQRAFQRLFQTAMSRWVAGADDADYAETWTDFRARVAAALGTVAEAVASGRDAIVCTSGGPIAAAMQQVLGLDDAHALPLHWVIANASYTCLHAGRQLRLGSFNVHSHLLHAGADLLTYR